MVDVKRTFGFWKTTLVGGLIFLLPLIVIGALVAQIAQIVLAAAESLGKYVPVRTPGGIAMLVLITLVALLMICFFSGLAARRSMAKRFSSTIEKKLTLLFPRYVVVKEQMAGTLGGDENKPWMTPVVVKLHDMTRLALEVDRGAGIVAVYLPGSPDPWSGTVAYVTADRVQPMSVPFADVLGTFEHLGRESVQLLQPADQAGGAAT